MRERSESGGVRSESGGVGSESGGVGSVSGGVGVVALKFDDEKYLLFHHTPFRRYILLIMIKLNDPTSCQMSADGTF